MTNYIPTIGIEVHVELKTKTKIFSPSTNGYGEMANSLTNVIDLGYPGTLPTLNKEVVNLAIKAATVLNCKIEEKCISIEKIISIQIIQRIIKLLNLEHQSDTMDMLKLM